MQRKSIATTIALGVIAVVAIPSLALGNARREQGSLQKSHDSETPYIAQLVGANEYPTVGDPDGVGAAAVTFSDLGAGDYEACWDMTYSDIATPTAAHIHPGAAGVANPPTISFGVPGPTSHTGCATTTELIALDILANPSQYYVNIHTGDFPGGALRGQLAKGSESAGSPHFLATPLRAHDSRIAPATPLAARETQTISLATAVDASDETLVAVPPGATAAIVTLTVTQTGPPSFLTLYSAASELPPTSTINWTTPGFTTATTTQVAVDETGSVKVTAGPGGTHFIIDVIGFLY